MSEENQNQTNLNNFNEETVAEQPAVASAATDMADAVGIKITDTPAKTDLKDLEISFNFEKVEMIKKLLTETQNNLRRISCLLGEEMPEMAEKIKQSFLESDILPQMEPVAEGGHLAHRTEEKRSPLICADVAFGESGERIIEGVFNGQAMVGADGKEYPVPANYASKSKLVEGDILKLTINARGDFVFKQIGPIDRARIVGTIERSEAGGWHVALGNKKWRVLTAPVTYFKGESGDEAIILIPKNTPSKWGAVENVIKRAAE